MEHWEGLDLEDACVMEHKHCQTFSITCLCFSSLVSDVLSDPPPYGRHGGYQQCLIPPVRINLNFMNYRGTPIDPTYFTCLPSGPADTGQEVEKMLWLAVSKITTWLNYIKEQFLKRWREKLPPEDGRSARQIKQQMPTKTDLSL